MQVKALTWGRVHTVSSGSACEAHRKTRALASREQGQAGSDMGIRQSNTCEHVPVLHGR